MGSGLERTVVSGALGDLPGSFRGLMGLKNQGEMGGKDLGRFEDVARGLLADGAWLVSDRKLLNQSTRLRETPVGKDRPAVKPVSTM